MKKPLLIVGFGFAVIVLGIVWISQSPEPAPPASPAPAPTVTSVTPPTLPATESSEEPPSSQAPDPATAPGGLPAPGKPAPPDVIRNELENVQVSLRDYRTAFGENPVGSNGEITKALDGGNPKHLRISFPPGSSVSGQGELCDRWGTPFFFHQLSAKQMEIHSAGPDHLMGTGDDIVVK